MNNVRLMVIKYLGALTTPYDLMKFKLRVARDLLGSDISNLWQLGHVSDPSGQLRRLLLPQPVLGIGLAFVGEGGDDRQLEPLRSEIGG